MKRKSILIVLSGLLFFGLFVTNLFAQDKPVTVCLFWTTGCPHCLREGEEKVIFPAQKARQRIYKRFDWVNGPPGLHFEKPKLDTAASKGAFWPGCD